MRNADLSCQRIQENIAWYRELSEKDKEHILSCPECSELAASMEELDSLMKEAGQTEVPTGFADWIMLKILEDEKEEKDWFWRVSRFAEEFIQLRPVQWILVGSGILFSIQFMFRFFFGFMFPAFG
jgi:hypothetical protein